MKALTLFSTLCLTAGALVHAEHDGRMKPRPATTWDTTQACGKAHLGCQMGVDCACHYFKDCNPDGSYTGAMLRGVDHCLCEYGWAAYCSGHDQFPNTPLDKRDGVETISILDEHPGHKTLNKALPTHAYGSTTEVTVVNDRGTMETLTPTTNAKGSILLATELPHTAYHRTVQREPRIRHTVTETLFVDDDGTRTMRPTGTASDAVTETVRIVNHIQQTVKPVRVSTITKVVTETVTRTIGHHHIHHEMKHSATVAQIGTEPAIPITSDLQLIHNHTLVKVIPQPPAATLVPVVWDPTYLSGWEHVMEMEMPALKNLYSNMDWVEVYQLGFYLRKHGDELDAEVSLKYALILLLRSSRGRTPPTRELSPQQNNVRGYQRYAPVTEHDLDRATKTMVDLGTTSFAMTKPTQTEHGKVYVNDPLNKYRMYDPMYNAVAPTGSCHSKHSNNSHASHNKHECKVEKCMWNSFMKPINITTAMPMAMYDQHGLVDVDYFTRTTELRYPHWGVATSTGLYYPTKHGFGFDNGTPTRRVIRATPGWLTNDRSRNHDQHVHGDPDCHDLESCHHYCDKGKERQHRPVKSHIPWMFLGLGILLVALIACLLLCCIVALVRHRRRKDPERKDSILEKMNMRRKSSKGPDAIVNQASGNATDPATGQHVDPASAVPIAVIAGAAAGAEAAKEKGQGGGEQGGNQGGNAQGTGGGDDGRGTTGRRAEEGRGRVNFEDGGHPGNEAPSSTEAQPPTEHSTTEAKPAGQTDGTGEMFTGRQMPDMGSMRGRKRNRPEGETGLHLGF